MTKLVSILISMLILVQSFHIHASDVIELDDLFEHAQFHQTEYGDNFFVFISKHYGELKKEHHQQHQEEKEDHEQLPFQHNPTTSMVYAIVLGNEPVTFAANNLLQYNIQNFYYLDLSTTIFGDKAFQPPRLV